MSNQLSDKEKELIQLNKDWIKEQNSFSTKLFFTVTSFVVAIIIITIKSWSTFNNDVKRIVIFFLFFSFIVFYIRVLNSSFNIKSKFSALVNQINKRGALKRYNIEKILGWKRWYYKINDGLLIGLLGFLMIFILSKKILVSTIVGVLLFILVLIKIEY